jgi:hypothetical protein
MKKLNELFDVSYGTKLDLNKMHLLPVSSGGIHFVGRPSALLLRRRCSVTLTWEVSCAPYVRVKQVTLRMSRKW